MSEIIIVELKNLSRDLQERGLLVSSETVDKAIERLAAAEDLLQKGAELWRMSYLRGNHRSCSCSTCTGLEHWADEAAKGGRDGA